jgi:hypothetical protein
MGFNSAFKGLNGDIYSFFRKTFFRRKASETVSKESSVS